MRELHARCNDVRMHALESKVRQSIDIFYNDNMSKF